MFIEVVHVNGQYSPEYGEHKPPSNLPKDYYEKLATTLSHAKSLGASVLYRPNLYALQTDDFLDYTQIGKATISDPFLTALSELKLPVDVRPDGRLPLDIHKESLNVEDELLRKFGRGVVLGAYTTECVPAVAYNIASRNPGYIIGVDPVLSIDRGAPLVNPAYASIANVSVADFAELK